MRATHLFFLLALSGMSCAGAASAATAPDIDLLERINARRADPPPCEGAPQTPLPPLSRDDALAGVRVGETGQLTEALRAAGYPASRAEVLALTGPSNAGEALRMAFEADCRLLLSPRYTNAAITQQGRRWQILLAQPLLDPALGDWRTAGGKVLDLVNQARSTARVCGNAHFGAAPALSWNDKLGAAALEHSRDMARQNRFGHEGRRGGTVEDRASRQGYRWRSIGENVAAGQGSASQVVEGWLSSPGHCANIMRTDFTEIGAAYATNPKSDATIYWTQVLGRPR